MVFFLESLQNKRSRNEDSCCHMEFRLNHEAAVSAFAIADGMGGLSEGNRYSSKAVSLWYEELLHVIMGCDFKDCSLKTQIETLKEFSENVFSRINRALYQDGMDAGVKGGTTLTTAIHFWDSWIIANCGDSPVYILKKDKVSLASQIQNVAWQLVREGKTREGSILFQQNKNRLMEYLGRRESVHPYCVNLSDRDVDRILMGTDGVFGDLNLDEIGDILRSSTDFSSILPLLMEAARDRGETDNQTAFLILGPDQAMTADHAMNLEATMKAEKTMKAEQIINSSGEDELEAAAMEEQYENSTDEEAYIGVEGKDYVQAQGGLFSRFFSRRK